MSLVALIWGSNAMIPYFCFSIRKLKSRPVYESVASLQCLRLMCINPSSNVESDTEMAKVTRERCNLDAGKGSCGDCVSASLVSLRLTKSVELDTGNRELIPLRRKFLWIFPLIKSHMTSSVGGRETKIATAPIIASIDRAMKYL